ncbi:MAG: zinc-dependent alcohol dehydrogenase family protein [Alphaproteobacteria bacterium]
MHVIRFTRDKAPPANVSCVAEAEPGPPGPGQVLVAIEAFPINPADLLLLEGRHTDTLLQMQRDYAVRSTNAPAAETLGAEGAGRIVAVGAGVTTLRPGQSVVLLGRTNWCERLIAPADSVVPVKSGLDPLQLAMLKINPATAWNLLHGEVALGRGDWFAQNAANSALGRMAIRIGRKEGLRSVNIVRREDAVGPCREAGGDVVLVDGPDLRQRVRDATGGAPIRLGLDAIGGEAARRLGGILGDGAGLVVYGFLSGDTLCLDTADVLFRGIRVSGFRRTRSLPQDQAGLRRLYGTLADLVADGTIASEIESVYDITDIQRAVAHAMKDRRGGKIVVTTAELGR